MSGMPNNLSDWKRYRMVVWVLFQSSRFALLSTCDLGDQVTGVGGESSACIKHGGVIWRLSWVLDSPRLHPVEVPEVAGGLRVSPVRALPHLVCPGVFLFPSRIPLPRLQPCPLAWCCLCSALCTSPFPGGGGSNPPAQGDSCLDLPSLLQDKCRSNCSLIHPLPTALPPEDPSWCCF